jgi:peroxiredoxin
MDDGGWKVVKPFLADTKVPYRMLLGDSSTAEKYEIKSLPDTFLIDRQGRIAAAYTTGLVNKEDVEANIRVLLSKR